MQKKLKYFKNKSFISIFEENAAQQMTDFSHTHDKITIVIEKKRMRLAAIPPLLFVVLMWLTFFLDTAFDLPLYKLGVYPLRSFGLAGVIFSPFVHASLAHVFSNTLPMLVLMWCLWYFYSEIAFKSFALLWLLSGFFTWIIGRESWHIGASGLVFALSFFLFFSGIFRQHIPLIAISLVVAFLYGSNVWNMFPVSMHIDVNVSWEAHLAGGISGFIIAVLFRRYGPQKPTKIWEEEDEDTSFLEEEEESEFKTEE